MTGTLFARHSFTFTISNMMRLSLVLLICFVSSFLQAQDSIREEFLKKIEVSTTTTQSISSDFEQIQELSILTEKQTSSGKFYFKNPGKMKWEQIEPSPYYFIFNEDAVIKFDGKVREQLPAGSPQVLGFKKFILGTVNGSIFKDNSFESSFSKEGNIVRVDMLPLKKMLKRRFDKVSFTFDFERMVLLELVFFENGGDKRTTRFFNHKIDVLEDDSLFR